ncbi:unnamed protein product [Caenorhabditis angaria]|uniref:Uncharacterized protein n=1 Tax=Caenorhabditis angaria TaxID=860376 RepID=A0A9P1N967_9PELO|nr:unnamed protein product [Caenorhabditis angaria]
MSVDWSGILGGQPRELKNHTSGTILTAAEMPSGEYAFTFDLIDRPTPADLFQSMRNPTNPKQLRLLLESMRADAEEDMRLLKLEREAELEQQRRDRRLISIIARFFKKLLHRF